MNQNFINRLLMAELGRTHLFSVGQAGYIIKSKSGQLLAIDLYLSDSVERFEKNIGFKRLLPALFGPMEITFDYVIATHAHLDHLDIDIVPALLENEKTKLFASVDCEKEIKKIKVKEEKIKYIKAGECIKAGDFIVDFVNCDHGEAAPDAVGVIVTVDGKRILETGDTCLRLDRVKEYLSKGPLDVLIAPINGAYGNMNEEEFAVLIDVLKPKVAIPCHYGMFALHGGSPQKFYMIMKEKYENNRFLFMSLGEQLIL